MSLKLYITGTYFACINLAALHVIIVKNQTPRKASWEMVVDLFLAIHTLKENVLLISLSLKLHLSAMTTINDFGA